MKRIILFIFVVAILLLVNHAAAVIDVDLDNNDAVDVTAGGTNRLSMSANVQTLLGAADYDEFKSLLGVSGEAITDLSATNWRIFYSDSGGAPVELALGADGTFLESNGASAAPAFRAIVAGDLPGGLESISGLTETNGGLLFGTADDAYAWLAAGTSNYLLQGNGAAAPTWTDSPSVSASNMTGYSSGAEPEVSIGSLPDKSITEPDLADAITYVDQEVTTDDTGPYILVPTTGYGEIRVTLTVTNDGDTVQLGEASMVDGTKIIITNLDADTAIFSNEDGVQQLGGVVYLDQYDSLTLWYWVDRWFGLSAMTSRLAISSITLGKLYIDASLNGNDEDSANGKYLYGFDHGETVAAMKCVFIATDGKVDIADANVVGEYETCIGISINGGALDTAADILTEGVLRDDDFTFTAGDIIYLSEDGAGSITSTAPSDSTDCVKIIGIARSDDEVYFNFDNIYVLVK